MENFDHKMKIVVKYTQERLCPGAFMMYQPDFITIAFFDGSGNLNVLADVKHTGDSMQTFSQLYAQINEKIRMQRHYGREM